MHRVRKIIALVATSTTIACQTWTAVPLNQPPARQGSRQLQLTMRSGKEVRVKDAEFKRDTIFGRDPVSYAPLSIALSDVGEVKALRYNRQATITGLAVLVLATVLIIAWRYEVFGKECDPSQCIDLF